MSEQSKSSMQVFHIKDLSTRSITFFPSSASINRDINGILLKPGINEVEIYGLSPTIDKSSVQVDGKGAATIVDMTVEKVRNRDVFEDTYPEEDLDSSEGGSESSEESEEEASEEHLKLKALKLQTRGIQLELEKAKANLATGNQSLAALDSYLRSANADNKSVDEMVETLLHYNTNRGLVLEETVKTQEHVLSLEDELQSKLLEMKKAKKQAKRVEQKKLKILQKKEKVRAETKKQKLRQQQEKKMEAQQARTENLKYWPKSVFRIILQLEASSAFTPSSTRRGSVTSTVLAQSPPSSTNLSEKLEKLEIHKDGHTETIVSLSLTYVTQEASWTPHYDLNVSSLKNTAIIDYRAEFTNHTSETWKDALVFFSTSQTSYQGLNEIAPRMHPWRVRLLRGDDTNDSGLLSTQEATQFRRGTTLTQKFNRNEAFGDNSPTAGGLFGGLRPPENPGTFGTPGLFAQQAGGLFGGKKHTSDSGTGFGSVGAAPGQLQPAQASSLFGSIQNQPQQAQASSLFGSTQSQPQQAQASSLFGSINNQAQQSQGASPFGASANQVQPTKGASLFGTNSQPQESDSIPGDEAVISNQKEPAETHSLLGGGTLPKPFWGTADPIWEDNGLTTTYETSQPRTIYPSSQAKHHRIATLTASNINLSHLAIPKLRNSAFLQAKIRNPSSITLLKGQAGITVDGAFLGSTSLPGVPPNEEFELSFGVDPAIQISYPKPSVKRSTQGFLMSKENSQIYSRNIWITNTKSTPVDLILFDQVPVSEDENLRIEIVSPAGLRKVGDIAKVGVAAKKDTSTSEKGMIKGSSGSMKGSTDWGSGQAHLRQNGEIYFKVRIESGKGCMLKLEYEARLPPQNRIDRINV